MVIIDVFFLVNVFIWVFFSVSIGGEVEFGNEKYFFFVFVGLRELERVYLVFRVFKNRKLF